MLDRRHGPMLLGYPDADAMVGAWACLDETVPAANESVNLSSITDNGTGDFTLTWSSPFRDGAYSLTGVARTVSATKPLRLGISGTLSSTSARITLKDSANTATDSTYATVIARGMD